MTTERSKRFDFSGLRLPPDWRLLPLCDVVSARSGNSKLIKGKQYTEPGAGRFPGFSASGQDVYCHGFEHDGGAVIISAVGARCGKCFLANGRWSAVANTHILFPQADKIEHKFLWYLVNNEEFWIKSGTAQPFVKVGKTLDLPIPVPPLDQQKYIVAEIEKQFSRLDEAVANLKRVKANIKRYKAAVLKAAVEGRLVETEAELARREGRSYETGGQLLQRILATRRSRWKGKGKYKEPAAPDTTDLPVLPEGWVWANVDQLAEVGTGATPRRGQSRYYGGDIAWVTSAVVNNDFVDQVTEYVTKEALDETNLTLYPPGTLLIAMYGEGKTRGKCSELRISATTNQALAALQADASAKVYLKLFLDFNYEETRKVASGGVQPNLNLSLVRAIRVPFPPLAEQNRIVSEVGSRLSLLRETEAQVDANSRRVARLRHSILAQAFCGEIVHACV